MKKNFDSLPFRVDRVVTEFRKSGCDATYTKLYTDLSVEQQRWIHEAGGLENTETPIIAYVQNPEYWVLLTDQQLVWNENHEVRSIAWEDIAHPHLVIDSNLPIAESSIEFFDRISVESRSGGSYQLRLEAGILVK